uniref:Uncharacterized protein n=1 Tax=Arundo donax TaxID=35708 RepID=A0A0A8YD33_ARUDO
MTVEVDRVSHKDAVRRHHVNARIRVLNSDHLAPITRLRRVDAGRGDIATEQIGGVSPDEGHTEGPLVAVAVVAAFRGGGAEHRRVEVADAVGGRGRRPGKTVLPVRQGVPDDEIQGSLGARVRGKGGEEGAAVAAIEHEPAREVAAGGAAGGGVDGDETGGVWSVSIHDAEEADDGRRPVDRAVAATEGGVGKDATPALAGEGGAEEARGLVRREAEEDLADEVVRQLR